MAPEGENNVGFFEYMGLPCDPEGFLAGVCERTPEEFLAGVFAYLGEDMDEALRSAEVHYPMISSPEELLDSCDPKRCGGSAREHLCMSCDCYYYTYTYAAVTPTTPPVSAVVVDADHRPAPPDDGGDLPAYTQDDAEQDEVTATAAPTTPPVSAVVVDADHRPATPDDGGDLPAYTQDDAEQDEVTAAAAPTTPPVSAVVVDADHRPVTPDDGGDLLAYTQDDAEQDEVTAAAAATVDEVDAAASTVDAVDVVTAAAVTLADEVVLQALGFDDFARDLKETIEAMERDDAEQDEVTAATAAATVDEVDAATVDEVDAAASTVDAVDVVTAAAATLADEVVLKALGFDDFARDLKETIEAMEREDALRAKGSSSSVSPCVRSPV